MPTYTYAQITTALRKAGFVRTGQSAHTCWQHIEVDGSTRRVVVPADPVATVPRAVLDRLLQQAGFGEGELRRYLGWAA